MPDLPYELSLPNGTTLKEFRIQQVLGHGGFGITYLAVDTQLDRQVAIKEFLPQDTAVRTSEGHITAKSTGDSDGFKWGLKSFLNEARTLAKFTHPNIVKVHRVFEANSTAYMVMEFEQGQNLGERLAAMGTGQVMNETDLMAWLNPILDGLQAAHTEGILHRDIKPENIYLRNDGSAALIDFGAARYAVGSKSKNLSVVLTPGYAPNEQYSRKGEQGPWTDIYALGGVLYRCVTGHDPEDAPERMQSIMTRGVDPQPSATEAGKRSGASLSLLAAIDRAMAVNPAERPLGVAQFRGLIIGATPAPPPHNSQAPGAGMGYSATPSQGFGSNAGAAVPPPPGADTFNPDKPSFGMPSQPMGTQPPSQGPFAPSASDGHMPTTAEAPNSQWGTPPGYQPTVSVGGAQSQGRYSQGPYSQGPYSQGPYSQAPQPPKRSNAPLILAILAVLLIGGGALAYFGGLFDDTAADTGTATTQELAPSGQDTPEATAQVEPQQPAPPVPVSQPEAADAGQRTVAPTPAPAPAPVAVQTPAQPPAPETFGLTVLPDPPGSTVRIMNIQPRYRDGIELERGRYHVRVSNPGYQTVDRWVELTGDETVRISLSRNALRELRVPLSGTWQSNQGGQSGGSAPPPPPPGGATARRTLRVPLSGTWQSQ